MALPPSLMTTLAALIAACAAVAGCGGGSGGDAANAGSQSVTPSTPSATIAATGDAASAVAAEAASAASAAAAASAASAAGAGMAPAVTAVTNKSLGAAATSATATPMTKATGSALDSPVVIAPRATVGAADTAAPSAAQDTPTSDGPTAKAMASTTTTGKPCVLDVTRSFGIACFAAATKTLADGTSSSFPNAKAGYRGSTTATCKSGVVTWSQETCSAASLLTLPAAASLSAAKTVSSSTTQASAPAPAPDYNVGVYYFGGWKDNQVGTSSPTPWVALRRYPDREPLLGYYAEDASGIMSQQLKWMNQAGIDFVVFNWYWGAHNAPVLDHAVKAYMALATKPAVKFALQWSNHTDYNFSRDQLDALFKHWINNYFKRPDYQLYNGKPVVYIFSAPNWARNAVAIGMTSAQLIERLNTAAKAAGLPGVSVIGGLWGGDKTQDYSTGTGFAAVTLYNYHSPANIALQPMRSGNYSRSYAELHQSYTNQWDWMLKNTKLNYIVPMTSGWDKRPWGGSKDPMHDDSRGLPAEFAQHLQAAKTFMESNAARTQRTGVVCCWNEFGEGSFIEPTKADGTKYLDQVRAVFGTN